MFFANHQHAFRLPYSGHAAVCRVYNEEEIADMIALFRAQEMEKLSQAGAAK